MKVILESIVNGFTVTLSNPNEEPKTFYVPDWNNAKKIVNDLAVSDGPPTTNVEQLPPPPRN